MILLIYKQPLKAKTFRLKTFCRNLIKSNSKTGFWRRFTKPLLFFNRGNCLKSAFTLLELKLDNALNFKYYSSIGNWTYFAVVPTCYLQLYLYVYYSFHLMIGPYLICLQNIKQPSKSCMLKIIFKIIHPNIRSSANCRLIVFNWSSHIKIMKRY